MTKQELLQILDAASEGASNKIGFFAGADRLNAVREFAGLNQPCVRDGTAPGLQRWHIAQEFRRLAVEKNVSPADVAQLVKDWLYGC